MELYHSFAFFFVLIGWSLKRKTLVESALEIAAYGASVITTTIVVLLPFLVTEPIENLGQILFRLFPIARGLFEDKVSNVWCTLHTLTKLRNYLDDDSQLKLATLCTLIFAISPCLKLLKNQSTTTMINCLTASALGFFLFSFQVHEKQALLFIVPAVTMIQQSTTFTIVLTHTAFFSLIPLFAKDGLLDYYLALRIMSYGIFLLLSDQIKTDIARMQKLVPGLITGGRFGGFAVPLGAIIFAQEVLWYLTRFQKPPKRLPDLWAVVVSIFSCILFCLFYVSYLMSLYTDLMEPPKPSRRPNPYQRVKTKEDKKNE